MKEQYLIDNENIVVKGEIAHHEQFVLFPQCFQKLSTTEASESVYLWERVKYACHYLFLLELIELFLIYQGSVNHIFIPLQY